MLTNPYATRGKPVGRGEAPPQFKSVGKKPVVGGRWSVRKRLDGRWHAWTLGKAKKHSHIFYTHRFAVRWAQLVAMYHSKHPFIEEGSWVILPKAFSPELDRLLRDYYPSWRRADLIYLINELGGSVSESAINRIMGDSRRGLGLDLARQSAINASSRGRKSRRSLRPTVAE